MPTFQEKRDEVSKARRQMRSVEERLRGTRNRAAARTKELQIALRRGDAGALGATAILEEIEQLHAKLAQDSTSLAETKALLARELLSLAEQGDPSEQIEQLDDRYPILLLPVRVEYRFMEGETRKELWVRIFPDAAATHSHENDLTLEEIEAGRDYWKEISLAAVEPNDNARKEREKGAWHALAGDQGGARASWIMAQTHSDLSAHDTLAGETYWAERATAEAEADAALREEAMAAAWLTLSEYAGPTRALWIGAGTGATPAAAETAAGNVFWTAMTGIPADADDDTRLSAENDAWRQLRQGRDYLRAGRIVLDSKPAAQPQQEADDLVFRLLGREAATAESWSRAPRSNVMPDRFVVLLRSDDAIIDMQVGLTLPNPLIIGPDPGAPNPDIEQVNGNIVPGEDIAWMYDFDKAVKVGLGFKFPLDPPHDSEGFDRLLVVGLRFSADPHESQALLEELIENHHHAPDGAGLIPQGTPTNNTDTARSGFLSRDLDPQQSLAVETGPPLFEPVTNPDAKADGQRLAEALGISFDSLNHLEFSERLEATEARAMNQALWPATLGHYLEQMLGLEESTVREVETYFVHNVSGRGPLPALRIGEQPYGVLLVSSFENWTFPVTNDTHDAPQRAPINQRLYEFIARLVPVWQNALAKVAYIGKDGDPYQILLDILGLHATSVDFHRRHAVGSDFLYNYALLVGSDDVAQKTWHLHRTFAGEVLAELGWNLKDFPPILDLSYFQNHPPLLDPLIDDVEAAKDEVFSETEAIKAIYALPDQAGPLNYIGWLRHSNLTDIREQSFRSAAEEDLDPPRPLLYRMLRHALLLANVDVVLQLYQDRGVVTQAARKQLELTNVRHERSVTEWELLNGRVDRVLPDMSRERIAAHTFVNTAAGQALPQALGLRRVRDAFAALETLPTARLERLFAEHVDLCSYRLDAWQTALFTERLRDLRDPNGSGDPADRAMGLHLGAFGWLEDVRPSPAPAIVVDPASVPEDLREAELGPLTEQPDAGGFIHGPSVNHAVTGAVLRNAYLTHANSTERDRMAVDLSSERARLANGLLEGIRAGQPLGALLGYRFERGLKENHPDPSLAQYIPAFRNRYPLLADRITPDDEDEETELKEARNVFDGYRLLELTLLADAPLAYPYDVSGLPPASSSQAESIKSEVDAMAWALDAVKDLALAEGVYQVTQGNYDRAGAMIKTVGPGGHPPEPEILRTPRSGIAINHRVVLHFDPTAPDHVWPGPATPRSKAEPAMNAWLGEMLGDPAKIRYAMRYVTPALDPAADATVTFDTDNSLADLGIEPIDLVYVIGEGLPDNDSELARRIRNAYYLAHPGLSAEEHASLEVVLPAAHADWAGLDQKPLFAVLPLLQALKRLLSGARAMGANDYRLSRDGSPAGGIVTNPEGYDDVDYKTRLDAAYQNLADLTTNGLAAPLDLATNSNLDSLEGEAEFVPLATREARFTSLRDAVLALAPFGFPDALLALGPLPPHQADNEPPFRLAWDQLLDLAGSVKRQADKRISEAQRLKELTDLTAEQAASFSVVQKIERYQEAAQQVLGAGFNLLPRFDVANPEEVSSALAFRDRAPDQGLIRHSADPLIAEEWFQSIARVRDRLALLETVTTLSDGFGNTVSSIRPLQLPYKDTDYWVAVEYPDVPPESLDDPDVFRPADDYLSIAQVLPAAGFDATVAQTGLLIDAWDEVIPNRQETTGIAINYNQPNSEPPQCLLLAVTPEVSGAWKWDHLISILEESLDRAKLRAVEPDQIASTALAHFLPAILTPTTSNPNAAIAAPLDFQTALTYATVTAIAPDS